MDENQSTVILASASPRRGELLDQIGINYQCLPVDIDESVYDDENAIDYVVILTPIAVIIQKATNDLIFFIVIVIILLYIFRVSN